MCPMTRWLSSSSVSALVNNPEWWTEIVLTSAPVLWVGYRRISASSRGVPLDTACDLDWSHSGSMRLYHREDKRESRSLGAWPLTAVTCSSLCWGLTVSACQPGHCSDTLCGIDYIAASRASSRSPSRWTAASSIHRACWKDWNCPLSVYRYISLPGTWAFPGQISLFFQILVSHIALHFSHSFTA